MSVSLIDGHIDDDVMTFEALIGELEKVRYNVTSEYHKSVIDDSIYTLKRQKAEIERLEDVLYDADGVNLVNYWHQQCKIAENGCRNFEEENENLKAEIERLQNILLKFMDEVAMWEEKKVLMFQNYH